MEKTPLANEVTAAPSAPVTQEAPHLKRVLGRRDLVLLFVVAVFNLNVLPSIAANGGVTIWLWIISLALFFWPQGIAVIELAQRYPGEGGVYLWAKEVFGDVHRFHSGWCYWTNNMMYVPTSLLYFVGVSVFALGVGHEHLADNKIFALGACILLLVILVVMNIVGLGVGKWINNIGGIGTFIAAALLMGLGLVVWLRFGTNVTWADFKIPENSRFVLNSFGGICFGVAGRFRADSVCCGTGFVYAALAGQYPFEIPHAVCSVNRARGGIPGAGADEFLEYWRAGIVSAAAVACCSSPIDSVSLY